MRRVLLASLLVLGLGPQPVSAQVDPAYPCGPSGWAEQADSWTPSAITSPRTAVHRALLERGINPGSNYHPYVQGALQRAQDIVYTVVLTTPEAMTSDEAFGEALRALLDRGLQGERVIVAAPVC